MSTHHPEDYPLFPLLWFEVFYFKDGHIHKNTLSIIPNCIEPIDLLFMENSIESGFYASLLYDSLFVNWRGENLGIMLDYWIRDNIEEYNFRNGGWAFMLQDSAQNSCSFENKGLTYRFEYNDDDQNIWF